MSDETIFDWLDANGLNLGPLTGTDKDALVAVVPIITLYQRTGSSGLLGAFAVVVRHMQPSTQHLAYHAIAHVMDWHDRAKVWRKAGLPALTDPGRCRHEPSRSIQPVRPRIALVKP